MSVVGIAERVVGRRIGYFDREMDGELGIGDGGGEGVVLFCLGDDGCWEVGEEGFGESDDESTSHLLGQQ